MGKGERPETGGFNCLTEGCNQPGRAKTKPSFCKQCQSRASYHRRFPDAPYRGLNYHGKWKGVSCQIKGCDKPVSAKGLCNTHAGKKKYRELKEKGEHYCPDRRRNAHLKLKYGIDADRYDKLFYEQKGRCAICQNSPEEADVPRSWGKKNPFAVDHCHDSGKVRGLLCNQCNLILKNTVTEDILLRAIDYLRFHNGQAIEHRAGES